MVVLMRNMLKVILGSLLLASSCGPSGSDQKKNEAEPGKQRTCSGDAPCRGCVSDFRTWLEGLHAEGGDAVSTQRGLVLPVVPPERTTKGLNRVSIIVATMDFVSFEGVQVADPRTLDALPIGDRIIPELQLQLRRELAERCLRKESRGALEVTLQVDRRVSWRVLRDIVATAESAGFETVNLAVDKRSALSPPGPSPIATQITDFAKEVDRSASSSPATLDSFRKEPAYREALVGSCKELAAVFFPPPSLEGSARERYFIDNWPKALESCGCNTDIEGLKALQWWWHDRVSRGGLFTTSIPLRLANNEIPKRIEHAPEASWAAVSRNLQLSDDKAYYFAITGAETAPPQTRRQGQSCSEPTNAPATP